MFLVIVRRSGPEYDLSRPLEEQSRWEEHAAFMDALVDAGVIRLGGPLGDEERREGAKQGDGSQHTRARHEKLR